MFDGAIPREVVLPYDQPRAVLTGKLHGRMGMAR